MALELQWDIEELSFWGDGPVLGGVRVRLLATRVAAEVFLRLETALHERSSVLLSLAERPVEATKDARGVVTLAGTLPPGGAVLPPGLRPPPLLPAALDVALGLLSQAVDDWRDADVDIDFEADRAGQEEPPPRPEPEWVTQAEVLLRAAGLRP